MQPTPPVPDRLAFLLAAALLLVAAGYLLLFNYHLKP